MLSRAEPYLIMFALFVAAALLNLYIKKKESENNPKFVRLLTFILILLLFLSLPVSIVGFFVIHQYTCRDIKIADKKKILFKAELSEKNAEIRKLNEQIKDIKYSNLQHCEDSYRAGKRDALDNLQKRLELERSYSYRSGYADGQKDYPLGINLLENE